MKIEKLNENKIRITFNNTDLEKNNIDMHSFMANSIESQSLFLNILDEAEREIGFITDDYKLSIELLALSNGYFIINVTRVGKELSKPSRVQAKKKFSDIQNNILIAKFSTLDDLCNFENFISVSMPKLMPTITHETSIYEYNDFYFLILENLTSESYSTISKVIGEFSIVVNNSDLIFNKLKEFGKLLTNTTLYNVQVDDT